MPFTLAHPAAVLPMLSRWRNAALALVIGSVGPDIQYFLPARIGDALPNSHTAFDAVAIGTPMALGLLLLLVACRGWIVAPLWGPVRSAVGRELLHFRQSPAAWLQALPATIAGCEIHLLWDSFTHKTGWLALHVPALTWNVSPFGGYPLALCRLLQYASSLLGVAAILIWCRRRLRRAGVPPAHAGWRPRALVALAAVSGFAAWHAVRDNAVHNAALRLAGVPGVRMHGAEYIAATCACGTFAVLYVALGATIATLARLSARDAGCPSRR